MNMVYSSHCITVALIRRITDSKFDFEYWVYVPQNFFEELETYILRLVEEPLEEPECWDEWKHDFRDYFTFLEQFATNIDTASNIGLKITTNSKIQATSADYYKSASAEWIPVSSRTFLSVEDVFHWIHEQDVPLI